MLKELLYTIVVALAAIAINIYWEDVQKVLNKKGEPVYVESVFGKLMGQTGLTRAGRTIYKFTKIPYAKPPVGDLRFEPPVPYGSWEGTLDATKKSPICTQVDTLWQKLDGQEDCLHLSIYTAIKKANKNTKLLPVISLVCHFMFGSPELFGPEYFLEQEVLLVTIAYRLNVLGFLNTADSTVTGNMGLKDQSLALSWLAASIKDFGGDPSRITLYGVSAGGASVHYHMLSKMSEGLFKSAIMESGNSLCPWSFTRNPWKQATRFASLVGCPTENSKELVNCLKKKPVEDLVNIHHETIDVFHEIEAIFGPSIEYTDEKTDLANVFLSESPTKLMQEGRFQKIPLIQGVTKDEGCFRSPLIINDKIKLQQLNENWESIVPKSLLLYTDDQSISQKIRQEYFPNEGRDLKMRQITETDLQNITNLYSDRYFLGCAKDASLFHSKHAPLYLYYYNKKPDIGYGFILECSRGILPVRLGLIFGFLKFLIKRNILGMDVTDNYGVCHTDSLQQLFSLSPELDISVNSEKFPFSEDLVKLFVSFARDGKPDKFKGIDWVKVEKEDTTLRYLEIGDEVRMIKEPFTSRLKFWEELQLPKN